MPSGKRKLDAVARYFADETVVSDTSKSGFVIQSTCSCCEETWPAMSGSRKVAHLCHIPGQGVGKCPYTQQTLTDSEIKALAESTKAGKQWLARGAGGPSPQLSDGPPSTSRDLVGTCTRHDNRLTNM